MNWLSTRRSTGLSSLLACGFLGGCATTSNMTDMERIPDDKGVMVVRTTIDEQAQLQWVEYSDTVTFGTSMAEYFAGPKGSLLLPAGERVWVVTADAGRYMWGNVLLVDRYPQMTATFHTGTRFEIKPGKITYVGDIQLAFEGGQVALRVTSNAAEAIAYLEQNYPLLMTAYGFEASVTEFR